MQKYQSFFQVWNEKMFETYETWSVLFWLSSSSITDVPSIGKAICCSELTNTPSNTISIKK